LIDNLSNDLASLRIDRTARPPSSPIGLIVGTIVVLALGAAGYLGYGRYAPSVFKTEVATTEVLVVSPAQASTELTGVGYVVAQRQSKIACQVLTRVSEMLVREGDHVKAGDILFRVEDAAQRAALSAARSRALASKARIQTATATLSELKQQLVRETALAEHRAGPAATAEDRREQIHAQEAAIKAAEQDAAAAEEDVRAAQVQLDYTVVRAPFEGIVLGKPLDVGELVGTFTEKPAVELCDAATLMAEIDVPEKRLDKIRIGGPAEIILEAYPDNRYRGIVREIASRVDRSKGTVVVKLEFAERPERLLPDMRARAGFLTEKIDDTAIKAPPKTIVPHAAVADRAGSKVVFEIENGRVRMVPVTLGAPFGGDFELRAGPAPGTVLVADPPETMADGQPVKEKAK
jgi:RND family efflux transporter MFP subunit